MSLSDLLTPGGGVVYLLTESGIACLKQCRRVRRVLLPLSGDPSSSEAEAVNLDSSLDLNLDAINNKDDYSWTVHTITYI